MKLKAVQESKARKLLSMAAAWFSVSREQLLVELNLLAGVVERKNTIPILTYYLLTTSADELRIVGTDLDVTLSTVIPVSVATNASVAVPGRKLLDILGSLPKGASVEFELEDEATVKITSGDSHFTVWGQASSHFPQTPSGRKNDTIHNDGGIQVRPEWSVASDQGPPSRDGYDGRASTLFS